MTDDTNTPKNNSPGAGPSDGDKRDGRPRRRFPQRRRRPPQKEGEAQPQNAKPDRPDSNGRNNDARRRRRRRGGAQRPRGEGQPSQPKNDQGPEKSPSSRRRGGPSRGRPGRSNEPSAPAASDGRPPTAPADGRHGATGPDHRPSTPPRPSRRRSGRRSQPRRYASEIPPGRMDRFSEIPEPPEAESSLVKDYEEMTDDQLTYLKVSTINEDFEEDFEDYDIPKNGHLMDVVGIKLHPADPVTYFDSRDLYLEKGNRVVVETKRGLSLGEVLLPTKRQYVQNANLPRVIRVMSQGDLRQQERNKDKEDTAYRLCMDRIERLKLPMKLIGVEYVHGGNKAVFYFSAEGRVDFRELVRDLAQRLHTRIEMRQIGVRDVSRMVGGIGICGCQLCCNLFLREFKPISIRMAKDQNLVLNPQKVSGVCGRLLCCLTYENEVYKKAAKTMPRIGRRVITPDGEGRIRDRDVLKRLVRVQLNDETILKEYPVDAINLDVSTPDTGDNQPDRAPQENNRRDGADDDR